MIILNPYKRGSRSAVSLREALTKRGLSSRIMKKQPRGAARDIVVSWGNSEFDYPVAAIANIVNHPEYLKGLTNKLHFFNKIGHSEYVPDWTTDPFAAGKWGTKFLVRHRLEASGGIGIEVIDEDQIKAGVTIPKAPLYVKYEPKTHEFRIHMARSLTGDFFTPLLVQRKIFQKTDANPAPKDWNIRNHENGFVYVRESGYPTPDQVYRVATDVMNKHFKELHFAALDVIFHSKSKRAFVLEGNTAPGLEGNTVDVYAGYLQRLHDEAQQVPGIRQLG